LAALALQEFEKFDSQAQLKKNVRAAVGALLVQVKDRVDGELRDDLAMLKPEEAAD
jgi:DNA topoisomerase-1